MDRLPPIPSPADHHWREFRVRFIPPIVFFCALAAVGILWKSKTVPGNMVGQVETTITKVISPQAGALAQLTVDLFQQVSAGEPVAKIITTNPKIIDSSLAVIRAEIEMMRINMTPIQSQQRVLMEYERMRLDWMLQRIAAATAKVRLHQAENEFQRMNKLHQEKLLPTSGESGYDAALRDRETARVDVEEKEKLVAELGESIQKIVPGTNTIAHHPTDALTAAIAVQEEKLRLTEAELAPITLYSPIDGLVSSIEKREGENVVAGEAVIIVTALRSDRILGFMRAPLTFEARPGMSVKVNPRGNRLQAGISKILKVGTQLETISPLLLPPQMRGDRREEVGLPVLVSMPPELKLLPGEIVDLTLQ